MHWTNSFIGLPFADKGRDRAGLDCWGLVRLVYAEVRGIVLPSYVERYASVEERAEISGLLDRERRAAAWTQVPQAEATEHDVVLFAHRGKPLHVGLVVRRGLMLHISAEHDSRIEPYTSGWWVPRLLAIHRYVP